MMQRGRCVPQQTPCRTQWTLSRFVACGSMTRCTGLTQSFLWQRWLTSKHPPGNSDLVRRISTIRATRCTFSCFLPSTGQLTFMTPYPLLVTAPFQITQSPPCPPTLSLFWSNFLFKSSKMSFISQIILKNLPLCTFMSPDKSKMGSL
jgi:hypothetical protein